jgi:CheY-like chemotaxis protein
MGGPQAPAPCGSTARTVTTITESAEGYNPAEFRILAVEDQFETIKGPLDSLAFDGYDVHWSPRVDEAESLLRETKFSLLIIDQRVATSAGTIDYKAGSKLASRLKHGELGDINVEIPFVFVTGSDDWVEEGEMMKLPGYRGILVKASDVTTKLRAFCTQALRKVDPAAYRDRVLVRVEKADAQGLVVVVPSWSPRVRIAVPRQSLPSWVDLRQLEGQRLFARMDLSVDDPEQVVFERWELQDLSAGTKEGDQA